MIWFADADLRPVAEAFQMLLFGIGLVLGVFAGVITCRLWYDKR